MLLLVVAQRHGAVPKVSQSEEHVGEVVAPGVIERALRVRHHRLPLRTVALGQRRQERVQRNVEEFLDRRALVVELRRAEGEVPFEGVQRLLHLLHRLVPLLRFAVGALEHVRVLAEPLVLRLGGLEGNLQLVNTALQLVELAVPGRVPARAAPSRGAAFSRNGSACVLHAGGVVVGVVVRVVVQHPQTPLQLLVLLNKLHNARVLRVHLHLRLVLDLLRPVDEAQRRDGLLRVVLRWADVTEQERAAAAAKCILQEHCQWTRAVRNMGSSFYNTVNHTTEGRQRQVDVGAFLEDLALRLGLGLTLGASEVDKVQLTLRPHVSLNIITLNMHSKDGMRSTAVGVQLRCLHLTPRQAFVHQSQGALRVLHVPHRQVLDIEHLVAVLLDLQVVLVLHKQVAALTVVQLQVRDLYGVFLFRGVDRADNRKYVIQRIRNDTNFFLFVESPRHCICFPGATLSISEDRCIITVDHALHHRMCNLQINISLCEDVCEHLVEGPCFAVAGVGDSNRDRVTGKIRGGGLLVPRLPFLFAEWSKTNHNLDVFAATFLITDHSFSLLSFLINKVQKL
eukprot:PhM_4_TR9130/c0_g1_i1/m.7567